MASRSSGNGDVAKMWSLHYRLITTVIAGVSPAIAELGLEIKELLMMSELDANPHPAALSNACLMPKPTVTMYVKRLEAAGYVKREIDSTDLRRHLLSLTTEGRKVMTRGMSFLAEAFGERLERLDAGEQQALRKLLEKLV